MPSGGRGPDDYDADHDALILQPEACWYLNQFEDTIAIMSRPLSASIACVASLASASAFFTPQTSHVPTVQSRLTARTMRSSAQQTIMGVATTSASATLLTDDTTTTGGLAEIDDSNFRDVFDGEKAVLIDACAPVS